MNRRGTVLIYITGSFRRLGRKVEKQKIEYELLGGTFSSFEKKKDV